MARADLSSPLRAKYSIFFRVLFADTNHVFRKKNVASEARRARRSVAMYQLPREETLLAEKFKPNSFFGV